MHGASTMAMWLQRTMPIAANGLSLAVPMQLVCLMDLLALSDSLVTVMVAKKEVGTWAVRRQFGGSTMQSATLMGTQSGN